MVGFLMAVELFEKHLIHDWLINKVVPILLILNPGNFWFYFRGRIGYWIGTTLLINDEKIGVDFKMFLEPAFQTT